MIRNNRFYTPPYAEVLPCLTEDRTLLTDGSGSQFDDISDGGEGGGEGWEIL